MKVKKLFLGFSHVYQGRLDKKVTAYNQKEVETFHFPQLFSSLLLFDEFFTSKHSELLETVLIHKKHFANHHLRKPTALFCNLSFYKNRDFDYSKY